MCSDLVTHSQKWRALAADGTKFGLEGWQISVHTLITRASRSTCSPPPVWQHIAHARCQEFQPDRKVRHGQKKRAKARPTRFQLGLFHPQSSSLSRVRAWLVIECIETEPIPRFLVKLRCFIAEDAMGHKEGVPRPGFRLNS